VRSCCPPRRSRPGGPTMGVTPSRSAAAGSRAPECTVTPRSRSCWAWWWPKGEVLELGEQGAQFFALSSGAGIRRGKNMRRYTAAAAIDAVLATAQLRVTNMLDEPQRLAAPDLQARVLRVLDRARAIRSVGRRRRLRHTQRGRGRDGSHGCPWLGERPCRQSRLGRGRGLVHGSSSLSGLRSRTVALRADPRGEPLDALDAPQRLNQLLLEWLR
jgi:hypothetical protein